MRCRSAALVVVLALAACEWRSQTPPPKPPEPVNPHPLEPATPTTVAEPVVQLSSHAFHSCAVRQRGDVLCWGKNTYGQLGDGRRQDSPRLVKVAGVTDAAQVEVGKDFSCIRRRGGAVACWGNNEDGQLGDGRGGRPGAMNLRPVTAQGLTGVEQISLGEYHGCALLRGGGVRCWGNAGNGQIGNDAARAFHAPQPIGQLGKARAIASGASHVCALLETGSVQCWGRNTEGQLGDGKSGSRIRPVVVANLEDAVAIASGTHHTCARRRTGELVCWGDNRMGQLGPGTRGPKAGTPVPVAGLQGVTAFAGGGQHTCARLESGRVVCWGANEAGQLGHKSSATHRSQPTPVRGVANATAITLGQAHSCALRQDGTVACWGTQDYGALGPHLLAMR